MQRLEYPDHRNDPAAWARALGISAEAVELYLACEVVDLHVDTYIWTRLFGYDLRARHGTGALDGRFYSQVDLPRALEAAIGGAMWSITTQPWRSARGRARALSANVERLCGLFASVGEQVQVVCSEAEYRAARASGRHAAMLAVQGGNALDAAAELPAQLLRVTLVHMTDSQVGATSSPLRVGASAGLGARGRALVERLNAARVFVDLAHISRQGFFDALDVHDKTQPLLVTHTGVSGVRPSWRNVDDVQLKRVADTGGVVGVVFHGEYLSGQLWGGGPLEAIVDHLVHIIRVAGPQTPALGSDWDGMIIPPRALRSCTMLPRLVQALLDRGLAPDTIGALLGANFLRALRQLRP